MKNIKVEKQGNAQLITVDGDIEFDDADNLEKKFDLILNHEKSNIIIDLSSCKYIDSHGLACLANGHKHFKEKDRHFILCNLQDGLPEIFSLTSISKYLRISGSLDQAISIAA